VVSPTARPTARRAPAGWAPQRQHVIWIDCNPQAGADMRDLRPMLVLSPAAFNERTGLVIGLSMTTASCNATNPFALAVGAAGGVQPSKTRYVLCHQPKSFDWRARGVRPHPKGWLADDLFAQVCGVLNQTVALNP
jgi:mRNA interferase MazF